MSTIVGAQFWDIALNSDAELEAAVVMLFSMHARAPVSQVGEGQPRGGWWGNSYPDVQGVELGSLFWTFRGRPVNDELIEDHRIEGKRALKPLITYGIARAVSAEAERIDTNIIGVRAYVQRPDDLTPQFITLWESVL